MSQLIRAQLTTIVDGDLEALNRLVRLDSIEIFARVGKLCGPVRIAGIKCVPELGDDLIGGGVGPKDAYRFGEVATYHGLHVDEDAGLRPTVRVRNAELRIDYIDAERSGVYECRQQFARLECLYLCLLAHFIVNVARIALGRCRFDN